MEQEAAKAADQAPAVPAQEPEEKTAAESNPPPPPPQAEEPPAAPPAELPAPRPPAKKPGPTYDWPHVLMLLIIMASLTGVFLGGLAIIVGVTDFEATDVVAVVSPALAAVGTVAAGVFGYSLGTRGTSEAQQVAVATAQQATTATSQVALIRSEAETAAAEIMRITGEAKDGKQPERDASVEGKRLVSLDDLYTLRSSAARFTTRLGTEG